MMSQQTEHHLEARVASLEMAVGDLKNETGEINRKLDRLIGSVAALSATKGNTWETINGITKIVSTGLMAIAMICGGLIWMNTTMTSNAILALQNEHLKTQVAEYSAKQQWAPVVSSAPATKQSRGAL